MFLQNKSRTEKLMEFESFAKIMKQKKTTPLITMFIIALGCLIVVLCLPWTQNIKGNGSVSSISPDQRPQQINSIIAGRIEKWYIIDGQTVKKGDTLLVISEVKEEYLDQSLLSRVDEQIDAKSEAMDFYSKKAVNATAQQATLEKSLDFKIQQTKNKLRQYVLKLQSDSIAAVAATNQFKISDEQLNRQKELYKAGLKSLTDLEQKQQYLQDALAKKISADNKVIDTKNELLNVQLELLAAEQEYEEKILKVAGDRFTALSSVSATEGELAKLKNQYANYKKRQSFYVITAPQSGQVIQSVKAGIGEVIKEGEKLMQIVPTSFDPAVEMLINPLDMALISIGEKVQMQFDGYPALVFSGWPEASFGVFQGKVVAVDQSINLTGQFRVWVVQDGEKRWPKDVRYGTGTKNIVLLQDVPLGYELWRQVNGFPPDYYVSPKGGKNEK